MVIVLVIVFAETDMPLDPVRGVAAGLYHNVVFGHKLSDRGITYTWGRNTKGQLGTGTAKQSSVPTLVKWDTCEEPNSWVCTPKLCRDTCGDETCVGFGQENPWWKEKDMHCMKPQDRVWDPAMLHPEVIQVTTTEDASYVLTVEGNVFSWGSNDWGQLGITDFEEEDLPRPDGKFYRCAATGIRFHAPVSCSSLPTAPAHDRKHQFCCTP